MAEALIEMTPMLIHVDKEALDYHQLVYSHARRSADLEDEG